jgi:hypothetical protein
MGEGARVGRRNNDQRSLPLLSSPKSHHHEGTAAMTESLGDAYPKEQERVRELLNEYLAIGPSGQFGAAALRMTLKEADEAAISGDLIRMIAAYQRLKECA